MNRPPAAILSVILLTTFLSAASSAGTGLISTIAGNGGGGSTGIGGPATSAQLNTVQGVVFDSAGNLFIADYGNNRVVRVDAITGILTLVAGTGAYSSAGDGGPATIASLDSPVGLAFDASGNLYISETYGNRIRRVDAVSGIITTFAGNGSFTSSGDGGLATAAGVGQPYGIAFDQSGNLYIAESGDVRRVDTNGIISTVLSHGPAGASAPKWLAFDLSGKLLISDTGYAKILRLNLSNGTLDTFAGNGGMNFDGDNVPAVNAAVSGNPIGLAVDPAGNVYLASSALFRIRRVDASTGTIATIAGSGAFLIPSPDGQTATSTPIDPTGITVGPDGSIVFSDPFHVRTVSLPSPWTYTATTLSLSAPTIPVGQSVTLTATSVPIGAGGTPTGTSTFLSSSSAIGTGNLSGGAGAFTFTPTQPGTYSLTASYGGDSMFAASVSPAATLTVQAVAVNTTLSLTSFYNPAPPNTTVGIQAMITPASNTNQNPPSGTIQLLDGGTTILTANVTSTATSLFVSFATPGSHSLTAIYSGDSHYVGSTSPVLTETINKPAPTVTLSSTPNPSTAGQSISLTATVSPAQATGTVQFMDENTVIGTVSLSAGSAVFTTNALVANGLTHRLTAVYSGDSNYSAANSASVFETVRFASSTVLSADHVSLLFGQTVTLTATVSPSAAPGTVQFSDGSVSLGSVTLSGGTATLALSSLSVGVHSLSVSYGGSPSYGSASSAPLAITVGPAASSVALTSSLNPSTNGQSVTFTATVSPSAATGTIQFLDGSTALGNITISGGLASLPLTNLSVGTHSITAIYSGDANFGGASSPALSQVVNPTPGFITTIVGTGVAGTGGTGGPAGGAQLNSPAAMAMDSAGNLFLADRGNNRVVRIDAVTNTLTLVAGNGAASSSGDGGPASAASLNGPTGVAMDAAGNLVISEAGGNLVRRVDAQTGIITTVAGNGTAAWSGDGGPAVNASLSTPVGLTFDSAGDLYIADMNNGRVRRVDAQTGIITTVAGNGANNGFNRPVPDRTPALYGWLSYPVWVSFDQLGSLLISESGSASIQRVDASGLLRIVTGGAGEGFTGDGGPAASAGIGSPSNVAVDPTGNLFFSDGTRIRRIDATTGVISTVAGNGTGTGGVGSCSSANNGDNGPATNATLDGVTGVLLMPNGYLLLSDVADCRVRRVALPSPYPYTATSLTADATSIGQGQNVNFTASVSPIGATGVASGTIQFVDTLSNSTVIGSAALNAGAATLSVNSLPLGAHGIVAYYSGDSLFNGSASPDAFVRVQLPTTITLTSSQNPATPGQAVTLSVTIPQLPSPSYQSWGNVNFMDGAVLLGSAMVWNGAAQAVFSFGTTGNHSLTAVFSGSGIYAGSTSAILNQVVAAKSTATVVLTSGANPSVAGSPVTFTATVSPASATGTVQFLDGSTVLGTVSVSGGSALLTISSLAAGSHAITAAYSGDTSFTSASSGVTQVVKATTSTTLAGNNTALTIGQALQLTASVSPTAATGTVQFLDGATALGTGTLSGGTAALTAAALAVGTHSLTAVYSGDAGNATSTSGALVVTVSKVTTSVGLNSSLNPSTNGQSVTFTATISPSSATGTVQFLDGATALSTVTISGGSAALSLSSLSVGAHSVTAVYSGDANNATSTSAIFAQTINKTASSVSLTSSLNPSTNGQSVTFTATISPSSATGTVQFLDGATPLGTVTISGGAAALSLSTLSVGAHSITAVYSGDGSTATSTSAILAQTVNKTASTVALTSSLNPSTNGQSVTFTATISPGSATGTVQFLDGATALSTVTISGGSAALSLSSLSVGAHSITAVYSGDGNNATSTSAILAQTVNKTASSVSLTSSLNPSTSGQSVTFTATVSPSSATGTVQFLDGATALGTVPIGGGAAALSLSSLSVGAHSVTAVYSGDGNTATSTSPILAQTVNKTASSVALTSSLNPSTSGQSVTFTATVSPNAATGTVQFLDGSTALGTVTISGGAAALSLSSLSVGAHSITAVYSGDGNNATSTSAIFAQTVNKRASSVVLTSSLNPSTNGQSVTFTATVSPSSATGMVQFLDGATALGTVTISGGAAALSLSSLSVGAHSITALYSGDGSTATSTSPILAQTVNKRVSSVVLTSSLNPSTTGQSVTFTATVSPSSATGTVQFLDGSTTLGTVTISGGAAALSLSSLSVGAHSITAVYSGDANNATSTSASFSQTVNKRASNVALTSSLNPSTSGQSVTFTATISPSSATGTVQFLDGSTTLGTVTISGGAAALSVSSLSVGAHSITAIYGGDSNDASSTSSVLTQTIFAAVPSAPTNLSATAVSSSQINLSWSASPSSGVTYNVYSSTTSGFTPSASNRVASGIAATTYSNTGLAASTTHYYRVTAQNSAGESASTNQANATTQAALACHVTYSVTSQWNVGFVSAITIKNTGTTPINGWNLTWTWAGNQRITQSSNSNYSQTGSNAKLTNAGWNPTIAAGATLSGIGLNASYSGTNSAPTAFYVNGTLCH